MTNSKPEVYLHLVWAVKGRQPFITPEIERAVHRSIAGEAGRLGCQVLALGGTADHIHLAVHLPTTVSMGQLMNQVKGVSSRFVHEKLPGNEGFGWQEGYSVFSISRNHVTRVATYIKNQKQHHAGGKLWPQWELAANEPPGGRLAEGLQTGRSRPGFATSGEEAV